MAKTHPTLTQPLRASTPTGEAADPATQRYRTASPRWSETAQTDHAHHHSRLSARSRTVATHTPGSTRVVQGFTPETVDGAEPSGAEPAPTTTLVGRRVVWDHSPEHAYEHVHLSPRWYSWQCLAGPERGLADTDENSVWQVRPGIYVLAWREKVIPCASVTVADHRDVGAIRSHGVLFGLDESGQVPTHFTFGAHGRLLSTTVHPERLDPAATG